VQAARFTTPTADDGDSDARRDMKQRRLETETVKQGRIPGFIAAEERLAIEADWEVENKSEKC
jgi:hypothetical protein